MKQYNEICANIIENGRVRKNRTGVDTRAVLGVDIRVDLAKEFPAITSKRAFVRGGVGELNWMLSGSTNIADLHSREIYFWDQWAIKGPHKVDTTLSERKRFFNSLGLKETWEEVMEEAKVATSPISRVCRLYGIPMERLHDDRYITRPPESIEELAELLKFHSHLSEQEAREQLRKAHLELQTLDVDALLTQLALNGYNLISAPTEYDIIMVLMDKMGFSREAAKDLVKDDTLEDLVKRYKLGNFCAFKVTETGELGPVYGYNWTNWKCSDGRVINQIDQIIDNLRKNPESRRHILSFWNVEHLPDERYTPQENVQRGKMALAPCHWMCEFSAEMFTEEELRANIQEMDMDWVLTYMDNYDELSFDDLVKVCRSHHIPVGRLNIHPHMRSWDFAAGAPVNLVFYATFCHMMAEQTGLTPGEFWMTGFDVHLYEDQIDFIKPMLELEDRPLPQFRLKKGFVPVMSIYDYADDCYELIDYNPHPAIRVPVAL